MTRERTPFEDTSVSVSRSQEQIRKLLRDAGAEGVQFSEEWTNPPAFYVRFLWRMTPPDAEAQPVIQAVRLRVNPLPESHITSAELFLPVDPAMLVHVPMGWGE